MTNVDTRQLSRDSLFLMARLRLEGEPSGHEHRVKVRNLSPGGMMAEGDVRVARGALISIELRNIGWVDGSVAWRADNRFGIAFVEKIDPMLARANVPNGIPDLDTPRFVRPPLMPGQQLSPDKVRKV